MRLMSLPPAWSPGAGGGASAAGGAVGAGGEAGGGVVAGGGGGAGGFSWALESGPKNPRASIENRIVAFFINHKPE
jgi:hypothetical protein